MCGIVGYTGTGQAKDILLEGLKRLEYRGYDSAGIAVFDGDKLNIVKRLGKVSELVDAVSSDQCSGTCGIGHTRWQRTGHLLSVMLILIPVALMILQWFITESLKISLNFAKSLLRKVIRLFLILTPRLLLIL